MLASGSLENSLHALPDDRLVEIDTEISLMLCMFRTSFVKIFVDLP